MWFNKSKSNTEYLLEDLQRVQKRMRELNEPTCPNYKKYRFKNVSELTENIYWILTGRTKDFYNIDEKLLSGFWKDIGEYFIAMHKYHNDRFSKQTQMEELSEQAKAIKEKLGIK